ncbi:DUF2141 domain-containing protein [Flavobacterium antarcticum]|uniref:DUF2141 domain-containing protein n=1 Tax=Flavobacterium antarcticum TaxID=271155 RepID=UPI0003B50D25|nr:DUF2141 domain-containing protein [Flavobacterium antarcticum]
MKTILLLFGMLAGLTPSNNPKLTIKISNIEKIKGEIKVGIFNTDTHFLKEGYALKNYSVKVENNTAILTITDLPKGEYAVTMYHDQNSDNECNKNFIGIPKEPYAFSNNIKPKMSAPKYKDCKFDLSENKTLNITLIN